MKPYAAFGMEVIYRIVDKKLAVRLTFHLDNAVQVNLHKTRRPQATKLYVPLFNRNAVLEHIHHYDGHKDDGTAYQQEQLAFIFALDIDIICYEAKQGKHQPHAYPATVTPHILVFHEYRFLLHRFKNTLR